MLTLVVSITLATAILMLFANTLKPSKEFMEAYILAEQSTKRLSSEKET